MLEAIKQNAMHAKVSFINKSKSKRFLEKIMGIKINRFLIQLEIRINAKYLVI
jgi:hypothetical protein